MREAESLSEVQTHRGGTGLLQTQTLTLGDGGAEPHWRYGEIPLRASKALFLPSSHWLLKAAWVVDIFVRKLQMSKLKLKGLAPHHKEATGPRSGLNHNPDFKTDYRAQEKADPRGGGQGSETGGLGPNRASPTRSVTARRW